VEDFTATFEHLDFRMNDMSYAFFWEFFISGLKDEIHVHVLMEQPHTWLEVIQQAKEAYKIVSSQTRKPSFLPRLKPYNPTPLATPLKI